MGLAGCPNLETRLRRHYRCSLPCCNRRNIHASVTADQHIQLPMAVSPLPARPPRPPRFHPLKPRIMASSRTTPIAPQLEKTRLRQSAQDSQQLVHLHQRTANPPQSCAGAARVRALTGAISQPASRWACHSCTPIMPRSLRLSRRSERGSHGRTLRCVSLSIMRTDFVVDTSRGNADGCL